MKKTTTRQLEKKLLQLEMENYTPTDEQLARITQNAFHEAMNRPAPRPKLNIKNLLLRTAIVAAVAVGFMVVSLAYSILVPVTVGNADNFMRKAAVWVNDKLQLGIMFTLPVEEEFSLTENTAKSYYSIDEAVNAFENPLVHFTNLRGFSLSRIDAEAATDTKLFVTMYYNNKQTKEYITISVFPLNTSSVVLFPSDDSKVTSTMFGETYISICNDIVRATTYCDEYSIRINSSLTENELLLMLESAVILN